MNAMLNRVYADYLMPSRLGEYEALVREVADAGYAQLSVREFFRQAYGRERAQGHPMERTFVHRHDIDSDLRTAKKMFAIESRHGVRASYYFRLCTLDYGFMREIEAAGSEASYHYEELAAFAKKHKLKDPALVRQRLPEIRKAFRGNLAWFEGQLGKKLRTVASHGDFANRRLKLNNAEILADPQLRQECGIECEAYDAALLDHIDLYIADRPPPQYYCPASPFDMLDKHDRICLVTHPRQVETNWAENTKANLLMAFGLGV